MNKTIKFIKKYQLIIFLSALAGLLLSFKALIAPIQEKPEKITPTPPLTIPSATIPVSPTEIPIEPSYLTPSPPPTYGRGIKEEEFVEQALEKYPLLPYLPYEEKKGINIKYTDTLTLEIIKEGSITAEDKEEILQWISDQGIRPDTHQITWEVK